MEVQIPKTDLDSWNYDPKIYFWANLGRKNQSCLFFLKIGTHGILMMLILIPTLAFWIIDPKSIVSEIWATKVKVVQFYWKLAHRVSRQCWFLFWHYFTFPTLNPFLDKFGSKNSKLFVLTKNWHTWYIEDADSTFQQYFFELLNLNPFLGKLGLKKSKLFVWPENWHTHKQTYTYSISKMLILISILLLSNFKLKSWGCWFLFGDYFSEIPNLNPFFGQISVKKLEFSALPGSWYSEYLEDVIVRIQSKV